MLPQETLRALEHLAHRLPERVAQSVVHLFRDHDSAKKLRETFQLVELLSMELLDRLNSAIVDSAPRPNTDLLRVLFEFARKETRQFSFGDRVKSIAAFARFFGARDAPRCDAFQDGVAVLVTPLPEATSRMVRCLATAREGRRDFDIPAARVADYVARHAGGGARAARLADLVNEFVQWRNADAHVDDAAETSKRWFQAVAKDPAWLSTLAGWLEEGMAALLLWQPLSSLLSGTVVRSLRSSAPSSADAWSAEVVPAAMQIVPERVVGRGAAWEAPTAEWWVLARSEDGAPSQALCPKVSWPTAPAPSAEATSRYRSQVALAWLQVGFVTEDQREDLEATAREGLLPDRQSAEIRDLVRDLVGRSLGGDPDALAELARLVPDEALIRLPLDALGARRADAVFALVEDDWPASTVQLAKVTGLSTDELAAVLGELERSQRITRRASGDADEVRPRWKELTDAARLLSELGHARRPSDSERRLGACVVALARLLDERFQESPEATRPEEPVRLPYVLPLDEEVLRADSFGSLCGELIRFARAGDRWEAFAASLPWFAPGGAPLLTGDGAAQDVSAAPTDAGRVAAMYALETRCAALGWLTVPRLLDRADADETAGGLWVDVRTSDAEEWTRVEGHSVRAFLGRLLLWLQGAGRLDPAQLPVASGHSRYVLNSEPLHLTGGPYLAPFHCLPGLYVETHNSRSGARSAARKVCAAMKVEAQDANDVDSGLAPVLAAAETARARGAFESIYRAASGSGLFPRYASRSVKFAPPRERRAVALSLQPRLPDEGGGLLVEWSSRVLETYLGVDPLEARATLGDESRSFRSAEEATSFCAALVDLLSGARGIRTTVSASAV
ncbi:MAG: hypothetical protein Q8S73_28745 [Deltaproteobacteria bacterium]|nr:hypothetical protein [Myxococcales bacterium]MDP3218129.1 hypothetical protein [Deltaproteobacteria bacterium]